MCPGIGGLQPSADLQNSAPPHDLRSSAGRFMAEAGVPIEEIAECLGHTNPNITRSTYARSSPEHLRHAAGSLEFGKPKPVQRPKVEFLNAN
ncbi:tyrosine-type recombinase/integrase [Rhodovulum sulfidophilum]|uniref:tyrosine-type recombinase/integrase n=1 Tax=Rhodovulum sulfidophilum TaxID=35806 RepID=UPI001924A4D1|nr:tyrosine-type recombinase/integrase [Rhodovulum sulfidophilum]MBL3560979.1 tyrosine-type recombinase/integrase [Rhodovulum sulfidophilum]